MAPASSSPRSPKSEQRPADPRAATRHRRHAGLVRTVTATLCTLVCLACGEPPTTTHSFELAVTGFAYDYGEGRRGLNLDGRVSDDTDTLTCSQADIVDPVDGEVGVDNAMGTPGAPEGPRPMPFEEPVLESLQIEARGDLSEAERLTITLGTVGLPEAELIDGRFQSLASPEVAWPFEVPFDEETTITLVVLGPAIEGRITDTGTLVELVIGGRVDVEETIADILEAGPDIDPTLVRTTFEDVADLDPDEDGACQSVSLAFLAEVTD